MEDQARVHKFLQLMKTPFTQIQLEALAGDASSRRYYRAHAEHGQTLVLTLYPDSFDARESTAARLDRLLENNPDALLSFANDPLAQIEMTLFFQEQGIDVPRLAGYDGPLGIIAFEDLGDERLIDALEAADANRRLELYGAAVDLIVQVQALTPTLRHRNVIGARLEFSTAKLMWEMDFFLTHFFGSYQRRPLSEVALEAVHAELEPLCRWLAERPQVLCHRDYHARNLMLNHDRLYMIDYQDSRLGPPTYDLVSLLLDPYVPDDYIHVEALVDRYRALSPATGGGDFFDEWHAMAVQRLLKAAGTYAYQTARRGAPQFERYLRPTLERAALEMAARGGLEYTRALVLRD